MIPEREKWLDSLRGVSISLVVLHHSYLAMTAVLTQLGKDFFLPLYSIDNLFGLIRMPSFFLCSGILFAIPAARGWSWFIKKRLVWTVWIVMLWGWATVLFINFGVELYPGSSESPMRILQFLLIEPTGNMWFIYAIALLATFCMAIRNLKKEISILLAFSISIVLLTIVTNFDLPSGFNQVLGNLGSRGLLFFTIGFVFSNNLIKPRDRNWIGVIISSIIWLSCFYIIRKIDGETIFYRLFLAVPATFSAIYILQYSLKKLPKFGRIFEKLGKLSLELFLIHQFLVSALILAIRPLIGKFIGVVPLALLFSGTVILSVLIAKVFRKAPNNFFFSAPSVASINNKQYIKY